MKNCGWRFWLHSSKLLYEIYAHEMLQLAAHYQIMSDVYQWHKLPKTKMQTTNLPVSILYHIFICPTE